MNRHILYTLALLFVSIQTFAQTYTYDSNNRLTKVVYDNGMTITYTFDALGNRMSKKMTTSSPVLAGDANGDGKISITDAVYVVNYVLHQPAADFNAVAADVNGDGNITITDAVMIVNIILGQGNEVKGARLPAP